MSHKLFLMIFALILMACGSDPSPFSEFCIQLDSLQQDSSFQEARALVKDQWDAYPDHEFELIQEMVHLNEKLGRFEDNLMLWEAGHKQGFFFLVHPRLPRFQPYTGFDQFDAIATTDQELRAAAMREARIKYEFHEWTLNSSKAPTLVIFHGGGSSLEQAKARWAFSDDFLNKANVIYLQSYRHYTSKTFGWRSGDKRGMMELDSCFQLIQSEFSIDPSRIFLTGISAGASMAIDVGLRQLIPTTMVIAFCPGFPQEVFKDQRISSNPPMIKVVAGDVDFYHDRQIMLVDSLRANGIPHTYTIIPEWGHALTPEYEAILTEAMQWE